MLQALWFDGRSSQGHPVELRLVPGAHGPALSIACTDGGQPPLVLANDQVGWPEAWSERRAPRKLAVDLGRHGSLEVDDVAGWRAALQQAGHQAPLAQQMQTRWPVFLLVLVVAVAGLVAFYRWGTPWAATQVTRQVPLSWELALSEKALRDLDARWLKPSRLPPPLREAVRARFDALARQVSPELRRYAGYEPRLQLQFRSGLRPNAFALPGGTIVITDGMVQAAIRQGRPDDALLGVLAHEMGHVVHRHTTRMVVEQGVLNIGLGLALGDVSALLSVGGSLLTGLAYRRGHETEADCFAMALLRKAGVPTGPMADLLLVVEGAGEEAGKAARREPEANSWSGLLSSHPDTVQRARALKEGYARGCA